MFLHTVCNYFLDVPSEVHNCPCFLPLLPLVLCGVHTCLHVCIYGSVWRPKVDIGNLIQWLFYLFSVEAASLYLTQSSPTGLVFLTSLLQESHVHFSRLELGVGWHIYMSFGI